MIHLRWILLLRGRQSYKLEPGWMREEITGDPSRLLLSQFLLQL